MNIILISFHTFQTTSSAQTPALVLLYIYITGNGNDRNAATTGHRAERGETNQYFISDKKYFTVYITGYENAGTIC